MKIKITVIMPYYNCENFIKSSIYSLINQTIGFENIELILIEMDLRITLKRLSINIEKNMII